MRGPLIRAEKPTHTHGAATANLGVGKLGLLNEAGDTRLGLGNNSCLGGCVTQPSLPDPSDRTPVLLVLSL